MLEPFSCTLSDLLITLFCHFSCSVWGEQEYTRKFAIYTFLLKILDADLPSVHKGFCDGCLESRIFFYDKKHRMCRRVLFLYHSPHCFRNEFAVHLKLVSKAVHS